LTLRHNIEKKIKIKSLVAWSISEGRVDQKQIISFVRSYILAYRKFIELCILYIVHICSMYVYFKVKPLTRIFEFKISRITYSYYSFQLSTVNMSSCEFSCMIIHQNREITQSKNLCVHSSLYSLFNLKNIFQPWKFPWANRLRHACN